MRRRPLFLDLTDQGKYDALYGLGRTDDAKGERQEVPLHESGKKAGCQSKKADGQEGEEVSCCQISCRHPNEDVGSCQRNCECVTPGIMFSGTVLHGNKYPHKAPTANVSTGGKLKPGVYIGCCELDDKCLGRCLVWSTPNNPIAEVYIGDFDGDLYGKIIRCSGLRLLTKDEMKEGYDLFLSII